jgi:hypothetical protein
MKYKRAIFGMFICAIAFAVIAACCMSLSEQETYANSPQTVQPTETKVFVQTFVPMNVSTVVHLTPESWVYLIEVYKPGMEDYSICATRYITALINKKLNMEFYVDNQLVGVMMDISGFDVAQVQSMQICKDGLDG